MIGGILLGVVVLLLIAYKTTTPGNKNHLKE